MTAWCTSPVVRIRWYTCYEPDGTFVIEAPTPGLINSVAFSADPDQ